MRPVIKLFGGCLEEDWAFKEVTLYTVWVLQKLPEHDIFKASIYR